MEINKEITQNFFFVVKIEENQMIFDCYFSNEDYFSSKFMSRNCFRVLIA